MSDTPGAAFGITTNDLDDDHPVTVDEATFDFTAWVAGVKPTRRSVKIYGRADLIAVIDELGDALAVAVEAAKDPEASLAERDDVARLEADLERAYADFTASGIRVVIEGRSEEWLESTKKQLEAKGVTDGVDISLHQLAQQVVSPAGVTADALKALREKSEPQIRKLLTAWTFANNQPVAIDVPSSRASSAGPGGRKRS